MYDRIMYYFWLGVSVGFSVLTCVSAIHRDTKMTQMMLIGFCLASIYTKKDRIS